MDSCREPENLSPPPVGSCCSSPGSSLEEEPLLQLNASATDITSTSLMADSSGHRNQNPGHERILHCSHNSCHPYPFTFHFSLSLSLVFLPLLICFLLLFNNPFSLTVGLSRSQTHRNTMLETQLQLVSEKCKLRIVFELQKNCTNGVSELLFSIVLPLPGASSSSSSTTSSSSSSLDSRPPFPRRPRPLRRLRRPSSSSSRPKACKSPAGPSCVAEYLNSRAAFSFGVAGRA